MTGRTLVNNGRRTRSEKGFTLIEVLLVAVIISILASLALPNLQRARERAMIARAIGDVDALGWNIVEYELVNGYFPSTLGAVGWGGKEDPWGNPYRYTVVGVKGGKPRKDHFLHPINTDFDLYSMGPDGMSTAPLTAKISQDDIIRANDGGFVGLAAHY